MPDTSPRYRWLNSTCAFVLAASIAVTLHETAHAVAGLAQDSPVVLRSFAADALIDQTPVQDAVMAATGPLFSLVFGVLVLALTRNAGRGFGRLFWLWLGCISVQNCVGYLIITPFGAGDTGAITDDLHLGWVWKIVFCVVGLAGYLGLAWHFLTQIVRYVDDAADLRRLGLFAWLAGTAVVVVRTMAEVIMAGAASDQMAIVVAGAAACGVFVPIFTRVWRKVRHDSEQLQLGRPLVWLIITVVIIIGQIIGLAPGVRLG